MVVDPDRPVPLWSLSDKGRLRMEQFTASDEASTIGEIWASEETKAREAADILAARLGLAVNIDIALGENDRSATGFRPPDQFEKLADAFFADPEASVEGWETAAAAQARILGAVDAILARPRKGGDLAIIAHGGVGTLLLCAFLGEAISRERDQPHQGCCWAFDLTSRAVLHGWRTIAPR